MLFAYIALIACGFFCIGFTIYEHKNIKQKNIDTEQYNQTLEITKQQLEAQLQDLEQDILNKKVSKEQLINFNKEILQRNEVLLEKEEILRTNLNELFQQKQKLNEEVQNYQEKKQKLSDECIGKEAQMTALNNSIETMSGSLKAAARASFEQYCDTLDYAYKQKEQEFKLDMDKLDQLYWQRLEELDAREQKLIQERRQDIESLVQLFYDKQQKMTQELQEEETKMRADLASIHTELEKIRVTKAAAMEAQLREEEIKNQATFYTLQLNDADKRDVAYLQSIEYNLREPRPLRMLIWSTFYRDKVNDLAARVGATGASGIYKITHIDSGISYIGQAKDIKERWVKEIKEALGIDAPTTNKRCNFMREKGVDNFTFEILEKCSIAELNKKEKFYIDLYQTYEFGLNGNKGIG